MNKAPHEKNRGFGKGDWKAYFRLIPYIKLPWLLILFGFIVNIGYSEVLSRVPVSTSALFKGSFSKDALLSAVIYNLLSYGLMIASIYIISIVSAEAVRRAQSVMWKRMLRLDMAYYDTNNPSNLVSTLTSDAETAVNSLVSQLISIIPSFYYLYKVIRTLNSYDFRLLLSVLILIPVNVVFVIVVGRWQYEVNAGIFRQVGELTAYLAERVSNVFLIRSFTNEERESRKGLEAAKSLYAANVRKARVTFISDGVSTLLDILQRAVPIVFGVYLLKEKYITMEQWVAFFLFIGQIISRTNDVISTWSGIKSAQGAAARMVQILEAPEEEEEKGSEMQEADRGDLVFSHVNFSYGEKPVLKDVSFTIPCGQTTAIVGRCGSGKSTVMGLVERLYSPNEGTITIHGNDIQGFSRKSYREQFAYVQQDAGIFGGTLRSAMTYGIGREVGIEELTRAAGKADAMKLVADTPGGFDAPLAISGTSVSGGQRQRIVLTRELLKQRPYLLLDEPTSALDAKTAYEIQKKLLELFDGTTILLITHDLRLLASVDQIVFLQDGEVLDTGTHTELLERCSAYRELIACQIEMGVCR